LLHPPPAPLLTFECFLPSPMSVTSLLLLSSHPLLIPFVIPLSHPSLFPYTPRISCHTLLLDWSHLDTVLIPALFVG
jgi:hypothetical protein